MLDWLTLDSDLRASKHMTGTHDMYTVVWPDKYYWIKTPAGDTWDINLYDGSYIYWWITELQWNTPNDYKKATHNTNFVAAPRCARTGYPGTAITDADSSYNRYLNCVQQPTQNLNKVVFEVWGPYTETLGGSLPANLQVLVLAYRWGCDNNYNNCGTKENYTIAQRYGLVKYDASNLQPDGTYKVFSTATFNQLVDGTVQPYFPCF